MLASQFRELVVLNLLGGQRDPYDFIEGHAQQEVADDVFAARVEVPCVEQTGGTILRRDVCKDLAFVGLRLVTAKRQDRQAKLRAEPRVQLPDDAALLHPKINADLLPLSAITAVNSM